MERLPDGVRIEALKTHADDRGELTEIFRHEWDPDLGLVQWNAVESRGGVLRGVHVHPKHDDYLVLLRGRLLLGLRDLRADAPTAGCATLVELAPDAAQVAVIPHGVAHGFYCPEPAFHVYAVSHYWSPADELGCRWDDPQLAIPWPPLAPRLSPRDEALPSFGALLAEMDAAGVEVGG